MKQAIKKIYNLIPENAKKTLLSSVRSFYTPSTKIQNSLHFKDYFKVKIDAEHDFDIFHTGKWIENSLFWEGINGYEKITIKLWLAFSKKADVILDVGANSGIFSLTSAAVNKKAKIYSFEPLPSFFNILSNNIKKNNFNILPFKNAVSNYNGKSTFYFPEEGNIYSSTLSNEHFKSHNETKPTEIIVDVITLKDFIEDNKIPKIDLLKIDAEGNDLMVLEGMGEYLSKFRPNIMIEVHNDKLGQDIERLVRDLKYTYYDIDEKGIPKKILSLVKSSSLNVFICRNEETEFVESLQIL